MENASNAMLMAASVLIGVLILGLVVIMFNRLSSVEATRQQAEEVSAETEFNKQFESYNRKMLYGTDIISISNLIADYNERQGADGYATVAMNKVKVTLNDEAFDEYGYTIDENTNAGIIAEQIKNVENRINYYSVNGDYTKDGKTYSFEELKAKSRLELQNLDILDDSYDYTTTAKGNGFAEYMDLSEELKAFKRKIFTCRKYETDPNTGRVTSMEFEEVNNTTP